MFRPNGQTYAKSFDLRNSQSSHYKLTFAEIGLVNEEADEAEQEVGIFTTAYTAAKASMMSFLGDTIMKNRSNNEHPMILKFINFDFGLI